MGISVDNMHGIDAERKSISEIHTMAIINLVIKDASVAIIAGTYISARVIALAFATSIASGIFNKEVIG